MRAIRDGSFFANGALSVHNSRSKSCTSSVEKGDKDCGKALFVLFRF